MSKRPPDPPTSRRRRRAAPSAELPQSDPKKKPFLPEVLDRTSRSIGANGAQKTPEAVESKLLAAGGAYRLAAGKLYNLQADAFIANHSDIAKDEVAHAILAAVATT